MKSKYPVSKIIQILGEGSLPGNSAAAVCRKYGIAQNTFYRWKQKYGGMSCEEAKRLKVIEDENKRLKKILAEKELEVQLLRDVIKKNP